MSGSENQEKVDRLLGELQKTYGDAITLEVVGELIARVSAGGGRKNLTPAAERVFLEIEGLARFIEDAKAEIAALRPDEVTEEYLPSAANELDAIVAATAEATNTIMDAAEKIESIMDGVGPEHSKVLEEASTMIYEACSFQDITGQRINKVVKTLEEIETKVSALVNAFGDEIARVKATMPKDKQVEEAVPSDEDLLQGPQLAGQGVSQDEIDRLLAEFD